MSQPLNQIIEFSLSMNEIAADLFIWLFKILGIYLALLILLTLILNQWKKRSKQKAEELEEEAKKRWNRSDRR